MEKRVILLNNQLAYLAFAYCAGKSYLFNMFFGWRESNTESCTFILSKRAWRKLENLIIPELQFIKS